MSEPFLRFQFIVFMFVFVFVFFFFLKIWDLIGGGDDNKKFLVLNAQFYEIGYEYDRLLLTPIESEPSPTLTTIVFMC